MSLGYLQCSSLIFHRRKIETRKPLVVISSSIAQRSFESCKFLLCCFPEHSFDFMPPWQTLQDIALFHTTLNMQQRGAHKTPLVISKQGTNQCCKSFIFCCLLCYEHHFSNSIAKLVYIYCIISNKTLKYAICRSFLLI